MEELSKALGTKRALSTVYHSQTDSQIERMNQEIEVFLQHYINKHILDYKYEWYRIGRPIKQAKQDLLQQS